MCTQVSKTDIIDYLQTGINLSPCICDLHLIATVLSHFPQSGMTALMWASHQGHTDIIRELLLGGAQVDLQTQVRHTSISNH